MPLNEPVIAVGLIESPAPVDIRLQGRYRDETGAAVGPGVIERTSGPLKLAPLDPKGDCFSLRATIGVCFHWQREEEQSFRGGLRLVPRPDGGVTVINDVPLETYLESVVCSEMRASSPPELIRAHAIISRSWLLHQLRRRASAPPAPAAPAAGGRILRWTDRQAHDGFDVCADDHCQRYQGLGRIQSVEAQAAVRETRGRVLTFGGQPCDARFSKCCGGISESFATAWGDEDIPYLRPVFDGPGPRPALPLREFIERPPETYCGQGDPELLRQALNFYDLATRDFFRWTVRLSVEEAGARLREKLGLDLGRVLALEPLERGESGRIWMLRVIGDRGSREIGKELEIRRALSETHLLSSAFVIDAEGPAGRPDSFVLRGAGWGHGVGLCQIGAAVMAGRGFDHRAILRHYYPGTEIEILY